MSRISPTLSLAGKELSWSCTPTISWTLSRSACGSRPISRIVPESGVRRPIAHSTVVVLPAPFGPRMPKISPSATENETSSTATKTKQKPAGVSDSPVNGNAEDRDGAPSRSSAPWSWVVVPDFPGGGACQGEGGGQQDAGFLGLELPEPAGGLVADLAAQVLAD